MAGKTNTEYVVELLQRTERLGVQLDERSEQFESADEKLHADINALEKTTEALLQRIVTLEERCVALQRTADRTWQVWLAVIVAAAGLLVSLLKK